MKSLSPFYKVASLPGLGIFVVFVTPSILEPDSSSHRTELLAVSHLIWIGCSFRLSLLQNTNPET